MTTSNTKWLYEHLRVVIMIAGKGTRFRDYSYLPKPMIAVNGKTILERTLESLPFLEKLPRTSLWFIVHADHIKSHKIDDWIRHTWGDEVHVISQGSPPMGNLDTAEEVVSTIIATEPWAGLDPVLFLDGDNVYDGSQVEETLLPELDSDFTNLYYFDPPNPDSHWCFVKVNEQSDRIDEVREKERFEGGKPIVGVFYFRKLNTFLRAADYVLTHSINVRGEYYMSQVFELLVDSGFTPVYGYEVSKVGPLGTPEDVKKFIAGQALDAVISAAQKVPQGPPKEPKDKILRICLDIDNTINFCKGPNEEYGNETIQPGALQALRRWKAAGHYIILQTARHMRTCDGNVGKVLAKQGLRLLKWLEDNNVPYDEIWWSKPHADLFIDDKAIMHTPGKWDETVQKIQWYLETQR